MMRLPGFLKRGPSEGAKLREEKASSGYATRGCLIGCLAALFLWLVPVPVAIAVWTFDLKGPFGDYMLMAVPFFLSLPIIGAVTADLIGHRRGASSRDD